MEAITVIDSYFIQNSQKQKSSETTAEFTSLKLSFIATMSLTKQIKVDNHETRWPVSWFLIGCNNFFVLPKVEDVLDPWFPFSRSQITVVDDINITQEQWVAWDSRNNNWEEQWETWQKPIAGQTWWDYAADE